jgi:anti-sigma regulatory factor (Ser/Thr protein kinase)
MPPPLVCSLPTAQYDAAGNLSGFLECLSQAWVWPAAVILDLTNCRFITPPSVAVLALLERCRREQGWQTLMNWTTVSSAVEKQLGRWDLFTQFGRGTYPWTDNAIPVIWHRGERAEPLAEYIDRHVLSRFSMSRVAVKEVRKAFCELFANIDMHAASSIGGVAVGQVFPNVRRVEMCVADHGVGIVERVRQAGVDVGRDAMSIFNWAMGRGHSTMSVAHPNGLGLYLLQTFARATGGSFRIYANDACYTQMGSSHSCRPLVTPFPGTMFELRLPLVDGVSFDIIEDGEGSHESASS